MSTFIMHDSINLSAQYAERGGGREKVIIIKRKGEGHMVADSFMEQVCFQMSAKRCQGVCFPTYLRSFYTFSVMVVCAAGRICLIALGPAAGLNDHQHPLELANLFSAGKFQLQLHTEVKLIVRNIDRLRILYCQLAPIAFPDRQ